MTPNTTPIFPVTPHISWVVLKTANTAMDGTGAVGTVFTAGAQGSRVDKLRVKVLGTNAATVLRVFMNDGKGVADTNSALIAELALPVQTVNTTASTANFELGLDMVLPAGYKLNVTCGAAIAAGVAVTCEGGDY